MIQINDLSFSYGHMPVLEHITMKLEPGRIYGLLGENGVGKTTLLTLLCGLKKPLGGSITVDVPQSAKANGAQTDYAGSMAASKSGEASAAENPFDRNPKFLADLQFLPDEVAAVNSPADRWAKVSGQFWPNYDNEKFLKIMKELETDSTKKMIQMSAGQLKKTYIAFALACNTRYIFMDEPTNGLDIPSKAQFRSAIMKYTAEDSTIVISTHQVRDLENIIDPIIILDKEDVLLNATTEQISKKLYFDYGTTLNPGSLYSEQLPGGFIQVYPNSIGEESKVNIEALFNTVHKHKNLIKDLFSNE